MHLPAIFLALIFIATFIIAAFCLWLTLWIFGLKPQGKNLLKIVGIEALFLTLAALVDSLTSGVVAIVLGAVLLVASFVLWIALLRKFAAGRYSAGRSIGSFVVSYILSSGIAVILALISLAVLGQAFVVDTNSMAPTLRPNTKVFVYKFKNHPSKGDVILYQTIDGTPAVARVSGVPGQTVPISAGHVPIVDKGKVKDTTSYKLNSSQYFLTFDNSTRHLLPRIISQKDIIGMVGPRL
jgi:signal peptidase I